jgi:hypothetical protein
VASAQQLGNTLTIAQPRVHTIANRFATAVENGGRDAQATRLAH